MICESMARKYCNGDYSQIKNYNLAIADKSETWDIHHRLETETSDGKIEVMDFVKPEGFIEGRLFHARSIRNKRSVKK